MPIAFSPLNIAYHAQATRNVSILPLLHVSFLIATCVMFHVDKNKEFHLNHLREEIDHKKGKLSKKKPRRAMSSVFY